MDTDGRDSRGRFGAGNRIAKGNPHNRRASELRAVLLASVTDDDMRNIAKVLVASAKSGEISATRELLNRLLGTPAPSEMLGRIEALEHLYESKANVTNTTSATPGTERERQR